MILGWKYRIFVGRKARACVTKHGKYRFWRPSITKPILIDWLIDWSIVLSIDKSVNVACLFIISWLKCRLLMATVTTQRITRSRNVCISVWLITLSLRVNAETSSWQVSCYSITSQQSSLVSSVSWIASGVFLVRLWMFEDQLPAIAKTFSKAKTKTKTLSFKTKTKTFPSRPRIFFDNR